MSRRGLLLVAHGSRRAASNEETAQLCERVAGAANERFDAVAYAFLELAEPDAANATYELVTQGCTEIVLVPIFLAAGSHVTQDLPDVMTILQNNHPDIQFSMTPHIGSAEGLAHLIIDLAAS